MSTNEAFGTTGRYPRFGVEEEFFLLDEADGRARPVAAQVVARLGVAARERVTSEFLASQLENRV